LVALGEQEGRRQLKREVTERNLEVVAVEEEILQTVAVMVGMAQL
jgi:hypothetical protein